MAKAEQGSFLADDLLKETSEKEELLNEVQNLTQEIVKLKGILKQEGTASEENALEIHKLRTEMEKSKDRVLAEGEVIQQHERKMKELTQELALITHTRDEQILLRESLEV